MWFKGLVVLFLIGKHRPPHKPPVYPLRPTRESLSLSLPPALNTANLENGKLVHPLALTAVVGYRMGRKTGSDC